MELEHTRIQNEITIEESRNVKLTVGQVKFFLVQLKRGNINDIKYRKLLINTLINKIYLYDDNIIVVFKPLEKKIPRIEVLESSFFEPQALPLRFSPFWTEIY